MRTIVLVVALACTLVIGSSASVAAPGQTTARPGEMTQARVWVQNRSRSEAVAVDLRDVNLDVPLRVVIVNADSSLGLTRPVQARMVRQTWEYQSVKLRPGEDPVQALASHGASGWEATGIVFAGTDGPTILLKRPRLP